MKQILLAAPTPSDTLTLFFAGWGMDERPFRHLPTEKGGDWLVCYDYRDPTFDTSLLNHYHHIQILAWSMGVAVADRIEWDNRIDRTAINGTPYTVHDQYGITIPIAEKTLQTLSEANLHRFYRRMCGEQKLLDRFLRTAPMRPIDELGEELQQLIRLSATPASERPWTLAIVGTKDAIIPPSQQLNYWHASPPTKGIQQHKLPHFPFPLR